MMQFAKMKWAAFFFCVTAIAASCRGDENKNAESLRNGVTYTTIKNHTAPYIAHVLEIDLQTPGIEIITSKADNRLNRTSRLSDIVKAGLPRASVIAAVNGDFFTQEGRPSGVHIQDGEIVKESAAGWLQFSIYTNRTVSIGRSELSGTCLTANLQRITINGFNRPRRADEVILYNRYYGDRTGTNPYGREIALKPIQAPQVMNDTIMGLILAVDSLSGNNPLNDSTMVLSLHGAAAETMVKSIAVNQEIKIMVQTLPPQNQLRSAIGGYPLLVKDNENYIRRTPVPATEFFTDRYARTAVGVSADSQKVYLVCIEGDQPGRSRGMNLEELADFMIGLGCESALNLDGGGSSEMMIGDRIVSRLSESGTERNISNALLITETQPAE